MSYLWDKKPVAAHFWAATFVGLLLYLPFRSNQWDLNGIIEALAVNSGGQSLFSPNHMLYRPIGFVILNFFQLWGYADHSARILQFVTLAFASLGIGFAFIAFLRLTNHRLVSILATLLLATSWSYWVFSTDVSYISPVCMTTAAALAFVAHPRPSILSALAVGFFCALSILFWQGNIFAMPAFTLAILWVNRSKELRTRLLTIGAFLGIQILIVGVAYIFAGTLAYGITSIPELITWSISHSSDIGGRPLLWGKWAVERIPTAAVSAVSSFIPIWEGLGLRELFRGVIRWDKLLSQASLIAFMALMVWSTVRFFRQLRRETHSVSLGIIFIGAYLVYAPFIVWWDPFEPKWFVVPNIFLLSALAVIWKNKLREKKNGTLWLGLCVCVIAAANFSATIWPRHTQQNPEIHLAECFVKSTCGVDAFIPTDWDWFGYAIYFFDYPGETMGLIRGESTVEHNTVRIEECILETRQRNGCVYVIDVNYYSQDQRRWIETELGLNLGVLENFRQQPAFICHGVQFMEIVQRK